MVTQLKDNTATRRLNSELALISQSNEERMLREIARTNEELADLASEVWEGMSNRVGDGFQPGEARKYAKRIKEDIYDTYVKNMETLMKSFKSDIQNLIGDDLDQNVPGGMIGRYGYMELEQTQLDIVKVPVPGEIPEIPKS